MRRNPSVNSVRVPLVHTGNAGDASVQDGIAGLLRLYLQQGGPTNVRMHFTHEGGQTRVTVEPVSLAKAEPATLVVVNPQLEAKANEATAVPKTDNLDAKVEQPETPKERYLKLILPAEFCHNHTKVCLDKAFNYLESPIGRIMGLLSLSPQGTIQYEETKEVGKVARIEIQGIFPPKWVKRDQVPVPKTYLPNHTTIWSEVIVDGKTYSSLLFRMPETDLNEAQIKRQQNLAERYIGRLERTIKRLYKNKEIR